ncbi:MAG: hypothetical protein ACYDHP_04185 [Ferrimicrobium sp.]
MVDSLDEMPQWLGDVDVVRMTLAESAAVIDRLVGVLEATASAASQVEADWRALEFSHWCGHQIELLAGLSPRPWPDALSPVALSGATEYQARLGLIQTDLRHGRVITHVCQEILAVCRRCDEEVDRASNRNFSRWALMAQQELLEWLEIELMSTDSGSVGSLG